MAIKYIDKRGGLDGNENPVFRRSMTQQSWATGAGHAEKTESVEINGLVEQICIRISSVTANPTVTITVDDDNGNELFNSGALADGTNHVLRMANLEDHDDTNYPAFLCAGAMTVGIDPSADAGGVNQTLTVDIDIYGR